MKRLACALAAATATRQPNAIIAALNAPDVRERLDNYGLWDPVIKASGFKPGS